MKTRLGFNILVGHYFAGCLLRDLMREGVLRDLVSGFDCEALARRLGVDHHNFALALDYVAHVSDVIEVDEDSVYRLGRRYLDSESRRFQLVKFLGAYSEMGRDVIGSLRRADGGVDDSLLAEAYRCLSELRIGQVAQVVGDLPIVNLLELGCGSAPVLREVARTRPGFRGWAFDSSLEMVQLALQCVHRDGLEDRIQVGCASLANIMAGIDFARDVDAICVRGILNAFFGNGSEQAIACLQSIRSGFPRAYVVVSDYYGRLNGVPLKDCKTLSHDFIQLLSGQGIPPTSAEGWRQLYDAAGYGQIQHYEDRSVQGIAQFIDVLGVPDVG